MAIYILKKKKKTVPVLCVKAVKESSGCLIH